MNSPKPTKKMDFMQAIKAVIDGKKICRTEWKTKEHYGFLNEHFLSLHKPDGKNYQWIVSDGDLFGTDWTIME